METAPASSAPGSSPNPMETAPTEFVAAMAESEAAARQAQELINHNDEVLGHISHVGSLALRTEVMLNDPEANLTNLAAQAEQDGAQFLERAGEGMTHLYGSLLDAGNKFPWADHYSKNYWFQFTDPNRYKGPTMPSNELWHPEPKNREELEESHRYNHEAHRYQRHISEHEHSFPYLDIEAKTREFKQPADHPDKQPVLDYLKSQGIEYKATWQLTNQQSHRERQEPVHKKSVHEKPDNEGSIHAIKRNMKQLGETKGSSTEHRLTRLGVQADVIHEFTDSNTGLTVKVAYGNFRSEAFHDIDQTPEVIVSDGVHEKHLGEDSWDQVQGVGLLLSMLEPGKEFHIDVPTNASDRVAGDWRDALGGMQKEMDEYIDQPLSTADFRVAQDKLLHHLNRSTPNVGWEPSDRLFQVALADNPRELEIWRAHYGLQPVQENDDEEEDEFIRRLKLVDSD